MWCERVLGNLGSADFKAVSANIDYVDVSWDECRSVLKKRSRGGQEIRVLLPANQRLRHGDVLLDSAAGCIVLNVLPCEMIVVRPSSPKLMAQLTLELGNLHWPTQVTETEIVFPENEEAVRIVERLHLEISREQRRFEPLPIAAARSVKRSDGFQIIRAQDPGA